jgi:hypothetical protein
VRSLRRLLVRRPAPGEAEEVTQTFEVVVAILLGVAALATAFAAYKASLDGGSAIQSYTDGIALTDRSSKANNQGTQELVRDQQIFLEFVKSTQTNDESLAAYIQTTLMSQNLRSGVEWWADQPDNDKYPTPFTPDNPKYNIAAYAEASKLDQQAKDSFAAGQRHDNRGDRYTLVTVILAAALFMLGIAAVARAWVVKLGFMLLGAAFLVGSLVQTARILWA